MTADDARAARGSLDSIELSRPARASAPTDGPVVDGADPAGSRLVRRYWYVRLGFGSIWAIDASLKWLPGFRHGYLSAIRDSAANQPSWLHFWFSFWSSTVAHAPTAFAVLTALAETAVSLSLLLGVLQRIGFAFGTLLALLIWGVGEGFGGPYVNGSTDIGCAVMYSVLFVSLALTVPRSVRAAAPDLDARIVRRWPGLSTLTFRPG